MTNNSKKSSLLLATLLIMVLGAVLTLQCAVFPVINECAALEEEIADARFQLEMTQAENISSAAIEEESHSLRNMIAEKTSVLYQGYSAADVDKVISGYLKKCGMIAKDLEISEVKNNGIAVITAEYSTEGSYTSLIKLIETVNDDTALYITDIRMRSLDTEAITANTNNLAFVISIVAYSVSEDDLWAE